MADHADVAAALNPGADEVLALGDAGRVTTWLRARPERARSSLGVHAASWPGATPGRVASWPGATPSREHAPSFRRKHIMKDLSTLKVYAIDVDEAHELRQGTLK
ncbi:unnamed protein product [Miscanthus lutarioriparius]|uniref:Uncharacterized protein n=1 Tax=Miscanthus lutarioriparius TaxID=422564 RepID=A0A811S929_9POAL|nr:unnamed protein product [Miscanthus lutarioriparius]